MMMAYYKLEDYYICQGFFLATQLLMHEGIVRIHYHFLEY